MFCSSCGAQIPEGRYFCSKCGSKVADPAPTPQQPAPDAAAPAPAPASPTSAGTNFSPSDTARPSGDFVPQQTQPLQSNQQSAPQPAAAQRGHDFNSATVQQPVAQPQQPVAQPQQPVVQPQQPAQQVSPQQMQQPVYTPPVTPQARPQAAPPAQQAPQAYSTPYNAPQQAATAVAASPEPKKKKKKTGLIIGIVAGVVVVALVVCYFLFFSESSIDKANRLIDEGSYTEAIDTLKNKTDDPEAVKLIDKANYMIACDLLNSGEYEDALDMMDDMGSYLSDFEKAVYKAAQSLAESGDDADLETALMLLKAIPDYKGSAELVQDIADASNFQLARGYLEAGEYDAALSLYGGSLGNYKSDLEPLLYDAASALYNSDNFAQAEKLLLAIPDYSATEGMLTNVYLDWAQEYFDAGDYDSYMEKMELAGAGGTAQQVLDEMNQGSLYVNPSELPSITAGYVSDMYASVIPEITGFESFTEFQAYIGDDYLIVMMECIVNDPDLGELVAYFVYFDDELLAIVLDDLLWDNVLLEDDSDIYYASIFVYYYWDTYDAEYINYNQVMQLANV